MYTAVTCDEILHLYCDVGSGYYWITLGYDALHLCTAKYIFLHVVYYRILYFLCALILLIGWL